MARKWTDVRRTTRAELMWQMRLEGLSQHEIARDLGISQSAVSQQLAKRERLILGQLTDRVEQQRALATARLDAVIAEAWAGWERSRGSMGYTNTKRLGTADQGVTTETVTRSSQGVGKPQFLNVIIKAQDAIARIWGFDRHEASLVEDATKVKWEDFTVEEIERRMRAIKEWNDGRRQKVIDAKTEKVEKVH